MPHKKRNFLSVLPALLFFHVMFLEILLVSAFPLPQTSSQQDDATILKYKVTDLVEQVKGRDAELALRRATIAKQRFMLSSALFFAAFLAVSLAVIRIREKAHRKEMKSELVRTQQQALSLQMNPHFIFNTLGSLQSFILKNDRDASNLYLTIFSHLMRRILNNLECEFVDLEEEVEALRLYLELQHMRFGEHFDYEIIVDPRLDSTSLQIPPFLIQPYVENAIHHGLLPGENHGHLAIEVKIYEQGILWVVEDNGIGRAEAEKIKGRKGQDIRPHGTEITSRRIDLLNRLSPEFYSATTYDLKDIEGKATGTRVEIILKGRAR